MSRLFGVVALERLEFQGLSVFDATDGGFFDDAVASGVDVVDTTSDFVVATDLFFDGGVGGGVVSAGPFVLEGFRALDPGATQTTFDGGAAVALHATGGDDFLFVDIDAALEDDVVLEIPIAVVQTFATVQATRGSGLDLLATNARAVEPVFAGFESVTSFVLFAVFNASSLDEFVASVDGLFASDEGIVLGDAFFAVDAFAAIDASLIDDFQRVAIGLASEEVGAVFPGFVDFVFGSVLEATARAEGQLTIATELAFEAVLRLVKVGTDRDAGKIFGDASFGHDLAALAQVDQTSAFDFGALGVAARATAGGGRIGREGQSGRGR